MWNAMDETASGILGRPDMKKAAVMQLKFLRLIPTRSGRECCLKTDLYKSGALCAPLFVSVGYRKATAPAWTHRRVLMKTL